MLPAGDGTANELVISQRGRRIASVRNCSESIQPFQVRVPFEACGHTAQFDFAVEQPYRPTDRGAEDIRELGFALTNMRVRCAELLPRWRFVPLYGALRVGMRLAPRLRRVRRPARRLPDWRPGISIVIPERSTPGPLERSLCAAIEAARQLEERSEIIVVVNGTPVEDYQGLRGQFREVRWLHSEAPPGFSGAVERGVREARFD